jgi:hypothetical protein
MVANHMKAGLDQEFCHNRIDFSRHDGRSRLDCRNGNLSQMGQNVRFDVRRIKKKQEDNYSGKKKRHMVKNNVVTEKRTKIVKILSATVEGKKHNKKLADEQAIPFPNGSKVWQDTGFQGNGPEGVTTFQPMKKPKGKELTTEQKQKNKELSTERIGVEHSIGGV